MHPNSLHVLIIGEIAKILPNFSLQGQLSNRHIQINILSGTGELLGPASIFPQLLKFREPLSRS